MDTARSLGIAKKAAVVYTAVFGAGSFLSIKRNYPAEALGLRTGWSTAAGVLSGIYGAGLAAPWHMVVQLWIAVGMAGAPGRRGRLGRAWLAFLSSMFLAGSVSEPISHKIVTRELPAADTTVAVANIAVPMVMLGGALLSLIDASGD